MTREEALKVVIEAVCEVYGDSDYTEKIFKTLEQEPCEDAVSRKAVLEIYNEWFATCNIADKKESPKAKINALPSVIPIRPRGHWQLDGIDTWEYIEGYRQIHCTHCGYKIKGKNIECTDYCPKCGSYNGGDEE